MSAYPQITDSRSPETPPADDKVEVAEARKRLLEFIVQSNLLRQTSGKTAAKQPFPN